MTFLGHLTFSVVFKLFYKHKCMSLLILSIKLKVQGEAK